MLYFLLLSLLVRIKSMSSYLLCVREPLCPIATGDAIRSSHLQSPCWIWSLDNPHHPQSLYLSHITRLSVYIYRQKSTRNMCRYTYWFHRCNHGIYVRVVGLCANRV